MALKRKRSVSQETMDRRMREIWIDGFGLLPSPTGERELTLLRNALRKVVDDDEYWRGLNAISGYKRLIAEHMEEMKLGTSNGKRKARKRRAGGKA
jgi:hypothetical protein